MIREAMLELQSVPTTKACVHAMSFLSRNGLTLLHNLLEQGSHLQLSRRHPRLVIANAGLRIFVLPQRATAGPAAQRIPLDAVARWEVD